MTISEEDLEEYEVIEYTQEDYGEYWREQMSRTDWEPAKELVSLLENDSLSSKYGKNSKVFMLVDGESLISFCVVSVTKKLFKKPETSIPLIYTKEEYRGNGCAKRLKERVLSN